MIDWNLAGQVARGIAGLQPAGDPAPFERLSAPAAESERLVSAYTGLTAGAPLPVAEAVGRPEWIDTNLASLGGVLDPVAAKIGAKLGPLGGAAGALLALEAGAVSGFLAGRVLGQYEFTVLDPNGPPRLLFVTPNLAHAAHTLDADPDQLLRWVALHETTHALQFGGVPWLREHLAGLVGQLLAAVDVNPSGLLRLPDPSDLRGLLDRVREDGLAFFAVGSEHRGVLESAQAFMALLEGYAEHVMDAVGASLLDGSRGDARRDEPPPPGALGSPAGAREADRDGPQAAPVRARQGVLRRGRGTRRDQRAQPRLGRAGDAPDARRVRRPRRLARAHRAARARPRRGVT